MTRQRIGQGWGTSPHPQILADQLILIWPNFYISSNFISTSFLCFDPTWFNLISNDSIRSKLVSFNAIWFNSIWFVPIWSGLIKFGQFGQNQSRLIQFEPILSDLNLNFLKWATKQNMTKDLKLKQALLKLRKCYFRCLLTFSFFGITGLLEDDATSRTSSCNLEYNTCTKLNQSVNIRWGSEIETN